MEYVRLAEWLAELSVGRRRRRCTVPAGEGKQALLFKVANEMHRMCLRTNHSARIGLGANPGCTCTLADLYSTSGYLPVATCT